MSGIQNLHRKGGRMERGGERRGSRRSMKGMERWRRGGGEEIEGRGGEEIEGKGGEVERWEE